MKNRTHFYLFAEMYLILKNTLNNFKTHSWSWTGKYLFNVFKSGLHVYIHNSK